VIRLIEQIVIELIVVIDGETPLHEACFWGRYEVCQFLLQADLYSPELIRSALARTSSNQICYMLQQSLNKTTHSS
jgi:ankyrin repeat protein